MIVNPPILDLMSNRVFDLFPTVEVPREDRYSYDFLGVRSDLGFNANWAGSGGRVKPKPRDNWEWISLLWAVATAGPGVVLIECGAGWGPWIVRGHAAARLRGLAPIRIIGIEAEAHHFGFMQQHFADNGVAAEEGRAIRGIVAAQSGVALFPVVTDPARQWGLRAIGRAGHDRAAVLRALGAEPVDGRPGFYRVGRAPAEYAFVEAWGLADLTEGHDRVDFIHFDIQGAEGEVIEAGLPTLNEKVRCITVGTHSSEIEHLLRRVLPAAGWRCMHDEGQKPRPNGVLGDGTQVWVNDRFL